MHKKLFFLLILVVTCSAQAEENPFLEFFSNIFNSNKVEKVTSTYSCAVPVTPLVNAVTPLQNGIWFQTSIWPDGVVPTLKQDVFIPEGMTITMAGNIRVKSITVEGKLRAVNWQANGAWINLQTEYILVNGANALFQIGTSNDPYFANGGCVITLLGTDENKLIELYT